MVAYYDEVEIEDFTWDAIKRVFHFPCPCGDRFEISKLDLRDGEEIATCPSCSLIVRVIFDPLDWEDYEDSEDDEGEDVPGSPASSTVSFHSAASETVKPASAEVDAVAKGLELVGLKDGD
ncbi:Uncharacterized conserved protein [Phaffia rhodozyma]|uniref:Diphthamide biosynthesis protein 3 n=1 Tax=Phaffia rhodozyma TaxID=264483 RepID=A0A0F7SPT8_PHARH|nr:Uncharacterized conserved protein [Phaffia rhodozyma]